MILCWFTTDMGAFLRFLQRLYSGLVLYLICLSTGTNDELLRSITLQRQLVEMAIWWHGPNGSSCILMNVCRAVLLSDRNEFQDSIIYVAKNILVTHCCLVLDNTGRLRSVWLQSFYELQLFLVIFMEAMTYTLQQVLNGCKKKVFLGKFPSLKSSVKCRDDAACGWRHLVLDWGTR